MQVDNNMESDSGPDETEIDEERDENENVYFLQFGEDVGQVGRQKKLKKWGKEAKRKRRSPTRSLWKGRT